MDILLKPFPVEESWEAFFRIAIGISVFIFLFLVVFEPFGISTIEHNKWFYCFGFALVGLIGMLVFEWLLDVIFQLKRIPEKYTFWKWILYMMGMIFIISLANFIFARLVFFGDINWQLFPAMIKGTVAIGIFPIIFLGGAALLGIERKYQVISEEINHYPQDDKINEENILSIFNIPVNRIRYVEALQNYVKIGHITDTGTFAERTERSTLKNIIDQVQNSSLLKCHRSFLVNKDAITKTTGNAQGLQLLMSDCDKVIPVSRSYVKQFRR